MKEGILKTHRSSNIFGNYLNHCNKNKKKHFCSLSLELIVCQSMDSNPWTSSSNDTPISTTYQQPTLVSMYSSSPNTKPNNNSNTTSNWSLKTTKASDLYDLTTQQPDWSLYFAQLLSNIKSDYNIPISMICPPVRLSK